MKNLMPSSFTLARARHQGQKRITMVVFSAHTWSTIYGLTTDDCCTLWLTVKLWTSASSVPIHLYFCYALSTVLIQTDH